MAWTSNSPEKVHNYLQAVKRHAMLNRELPGLPEHLRKETHRLIASAERKRCRLWNNLSTEERTRVEREFCSS